ncbi:MAG: Hpt domain-containing protein, partial [Arenimonas sp.]|nr:Hpt domain-containing protein [Arenimonas sp.]
MKLLSPIDVTVLTWLKPELDSTLHQARNCLEQYVEDGQGVTVLRECGQHLHQVAGILNMVELTGAARLAEEMEQLSGGLAEDKAQSNENAFSLLMQCIVQLPDYLERLQNGHRDVPEVLLPLINELRSIGNHPPLSEESVYTASTQLPIPEAALSAMRAQDDGEGFGQLALHFQAHLLAWLNGQDDRAAAGHLASSCERIVAHCQDDSSKKLFWVASCLLHAVAAGKLEASKSLRQSIVKIDQEVSYINNRSTGEARQSSPVRMCQELLYFVSQAPDASPDLRQVYETFDLDHNIPDEAEIKHAKSSLLGRNNALLQSVSAVIKEDILRVKDSLDMAIRQTDSKPVDMAGLVDVLARIESTLGLIDANKAKELIRVNKEVVSGFAASGDSPGESKLMEIAKSLLSVEMMLDHKVADVASRKQAKLASDFLSSSQSNQLLDALIRESIVNFTLARQAYVAFVESYWDHEQLAAVPTLLKQISGALAILEFTPVSSYIDAINAFTRFEFIEKKGMPNGEQMERLAEVLASLEYYLESVRDRRPNRERILEITQKSLEALHYWPVPDYALHAVTAPVAAYAPVEALKPAEQPVAASTVEAPAVQAVKPAEASDWTIGVDESGDSLLGFDLGAEGIDDEIREIFLEEFAEESGNLNSFYDKWKSEPENFELIRPLRRVFHTLKGSGRLVGAIALSEFSWKIESLLNRVLDESRPASDSVVSMIGIAIDALPKFQQALLGEKAYLDVEGLSDVAERLAAGEELVYQPKQVAAEPAAQHQAADARMPEAGPIIDPVLLEILKPEVGGHLETVNRWLQQAAMTDSPVFGDEVFRAIHTMNGAFAMTEVSSMAGVLAPAESLIRRSIAHHIGVKAEVVACLAQVADAVQATLDDLSNNVLPNAYPDLEAWVSAKRDELPELPTTAVAPMVFADMEAQRLEAEHIEAEQAAADRAEADRAEAERVEAERVEAERVEAERVEAERVEAERVEA